MTKETKRKQQEKKTETKRKPKRQVGLLGLLGEAIVGEKGLTKTGNREKDSASVPCKMLKPTGEDGWR